MRELTREEKIAIIQASNDAFERGDLRESGRLIKENFPLAPYIAMALKEECGREYLLRSGWDLSQAEAQYGQGWLDR